MQWRTAHARNHADIGDIESLIPSPTSYWPAEKQSLVDFMVFDLDALLAQLRAAEAEVDARIEEHECGRFGWAVDPEGNRIELWQPLSE